MTNHSQKLLTLTSVAGIIGLLMFVMWFFSRPKTVYGNLDKFATCLTAKEVTMYGAYWCPHCADQKELFGSAFKNVNYVECTEEIKTCLEKKVDGYPTWIFKNGERLVGKYPLETLAEKSGCDIKATLYGKNK